MIEADENTLILTSDKVSVSDCEDDLEKREPVVSRNDKSIEQFLIVVGEVAKDLISMREIKREKERELQILERTQKHELTMMNERYSRVKKGIDIHVKQIDGMMKKLEYFDVVNMNESQTKIYFGMVGEISKIRDGLISLYDRVL